MDEARGKRGRLGAIDLLPEEAKPHVTAALVALKERRRTQDDIRDELNTHLLALGCEPVSRSAFNRKALWLAAYGRQMQDAREVAAVLAEKLNEVPEGDVGLLLNETLKTMIYDAVMEVSLDDGAASVKMLKEASLALGRLESARRISVDTRKRIMNDFQAKAETAVDTVAKAKGLTAETVEEIKAKILGIARG